MRSGGGIYPAAGREPLSQVGMSLGSGGVKGAIHRIRNSIIRKRTKGNDTAMIRWVIFVEKGSSAMFVFLSCLTPEQVEAPVVPPEAEKQKSSGCTLTEFWSHGDPKGRLIHVDLRYADTNLAPMLVDVIHDNRVVLGFECIQGGEQELRVPDLNGSWMMAYADLDQDGPSRLDPQGRSSVLTKDEEQYRIVLKPGEVVEEAFELSPPQAPR